MKKAVIAILVLAFLGFASALYVLGFTAMPLRWAGETFCKSESGCQISAIDGSLAHGISVSAFSLKSSSVDFSAQGLSFKYSALWKTFVSRSFFIEEINIDRLRLHVLQLPEFKSASSSSSSASAPADSDSNDESEQLPLTVAGGGAIAAAGEFGIRRVNVRNVELILPSAPAPFLLQEFQLQDFISANGDISLEGLMLKSSALELRLGGLNIQKDQITLRDRMIGTIHPGILPGLKRSVPFSAIFQKNGQISQGDLSLDDGRLTAMVNSDQTVTFQTKQLSPKDYADTTFPLSEISLKLTAPNLESVLQPQGPSELNLKFGRVAFHSLPSESAANDIIEDVTVPETTPPPVSMPKKMPGAWATLLSEEAGQRVVINILPGFVPDSSNSQPFLEIGSSHEQDVKAVLAELMQGKAYAKASDAEKAEIDAHATYFKPLSSPFHVILGEPAPQEKARGKKPALKSLTNSALTNGRGVHPASSRVGGSAPRTPAQRKAAPRTAMPRAPGSRITAPGNPASRAPASAPQRLQKPQRPQNPPARKN